MTDLTTRVDELAADSGRSDHRRLSLRSLALRKGTLVGMAGLALIVAAAVLAPWIAPHNPIAPDLTTTLAPPFWVESGSMDHPLGTDAIGRDVASRLLYGARNSLIIAGAAMLIGSLLGLITGLVAGFYGGPLDAVLMRTGDIQLAFPFILLAIVILGVVPDRTAIHLILVLGIPGWIIYARVVRSRAIAEREKDHVLAARALGASSVRRMIRYVLPSVWQVVPVIALLDLGFLVILESTLSFLGFGLTPPTPSWGSILAEGRTNLVLSPWLPVLPGLAIMFTVLAINLIADGLADVLDPGTRKGTFRRYVLGLPAPHDVPVSALPSLVEVRNLCVEFPVGDKTIQAVRGVTFALDRGETLGIVGESGSGKSVTALSILQLLDAPGRVTKGEILFDGRDLLRVRDKEMAALRGRRIGMIFQNPSSSLNPVLSIGYQMVEVLRSYGAKDAEARILAAESLQSVGIGDPARVLRQYPFQLSGGMNQRVMIAMAMSARPDLLIADEPTTALDVTTQAQILERLGEVTRRHRTSVVLITHDIALVAEFADRIAVMYAGQVCETGPATQVIADPRHPYTKALLESVPRIDLPTGVRLPAIPGELPDPGTSVAGCPFAPRCPSVMEVCWTVNPALLEISPGRQTACHLWSPDRMEELAG